MSALVNGCQGNHSLNRILIDAYGAELRGMHRGEILESPGSAVHRLLFSLIAS